MNKQKIEEIIRLYDEELEERGVEPINFAHKEYPKTDEEKLGHVRGMIPQMFQFLEEERTDKVMRWLGFIQGVFWSQGIYSVEEMKDHNRP